MEEGVPYISDSMFANTQITKITIPYSVTQIGATSFYNCSLLARITIHTTVLQIGSNAFKNDAVLASVIFEGGYQSGYAANAFSGSTPQPIVNFATNKLNDWPSLTYFTGQTFVEAPSGLPPDRRGVVRILGTTITTNRTVLK